MNRPCTFESWEWCNECGDFSVAGSAVFDSSWLQISCKFWITHIFMGWTICRTFKSPNPSRNPSNLSPDPSPSPFPPPQSSPNKSDNRILKALLREFHSRVVLSFVRKKRIINFLCSHLTIGIFCYVYTLMIANNVCSYYLFMEIHKCENNMRQYWKIYDFLFTFVWNSLFFLLLQWILKWMTNDWDVVGTSVGFHSFFGSDGEHLEKITEQQ